MGNVAQPNVTQLFDDLFLRGRPVDPSFEWQPLAERTASDDTTHHFYGAWHGPRGIKAAAAPYASRVAGVHAPYLDSVVAGVPTTTEPTVYMTGGGTASGKTVAILNNPQVGFPERGKAAYIDADSAMTLIPEYQQGLARGEKDAASLAHTEASFMSKMGLSYALRTGHHVVYDAVGDSGIDSLKAKVEGMRADGAKHVFADYATVSIDTALQRAQARALKTGRWVPESFIRVAHQDVSRTWLNAAREGIFDRLRLWDTNGAAPVLVATATGGNITIQNQSAWDAFQQIAGGLNG